MAERRGAATVGAACGACLARAGLLARLAGALDHVGGALGELLALGDADLIAAVGGQQRDAITRAHASFSVQRARAQATAARLTLVCRCQPTYPRPLRELTAPPAVLHIAGRPEVMLERSPAVAVVGARAASPYGIEVARGLGRGLAAAGLIVVSGMARGIDSAAHRGALEVAGETIAVLAGGAERAYPASARALHAQIRARGAVVSELPPGTGNRRWMFPARNRLIAGLAALTVVVEAGAGSGALLTAAFARELAREVAAVPGRVTSPLAVGPHELIGAGAALVTGAGDVLERLAVAPAAPSATPWAVPAGLPAAQRALLGALAEGRPTETARARARLSTDDGLAALAALELAGLIAREPGGRWTIRVR